MKAITRSELPSLLQAAHIKTRLRQEVRFAPDEVADWNELEFIAVSDRTGAKGVLIIEQDGQRYITAYEVNKRAADRNGRTKPVICDLCFTWQKGAASGRLRFTRLSDMHDITLLCCQDLQCSNHVRNKTAAAQLSRAHLRENIDTSQRVERLRQKLRELTAHLDLQPVSSGLPWPNTIAS